MQPLKDYLNESPLQHESILDPNQDQVMNKMTDDVIRQRIREYCTYDSRKYARGEQWVSAHPDYKIVKIDKDNIGWYIETRSAMNVGVIYGTLEKSFYDFLLSHRCKIDAQKGFLIEDLDIYFRWRKHNGLLEIGDSPNLVIMGLCIVFTFLWARIAAVFANKAKPETLNRAVGIVLTVLGVVILVFNFLK